MDKSKNIIIQSVFWILFFLLVNRIIGIRGDSDFRALMVSFTMVFFFASISYLNFWILIPELLTRKKYLLYAIIIIAILILTPILFMKLGLIHMPPPRHGHGHGHGIMRRMYNPINPKFLLIFFITSLFIFVSTIIRLSLDFAKKDKQKIHVEKERLLIETQYLRSQMNPHFFLNALNNLQYINRFLPQQSEKYINTLAEMMRYVTYDCKKDKVYIEKEVEYIENYIYFQQIKDDEVEVIFKVDIQEKETLIEPMLLMPFVENAFKYGIFDDAKNHPIFITIKQDKKIIYFSCKNSINHTIKANTDPSYSGLGIKNVEDRLKVSYPNNHILKIENDDVHFSIDLILNP